MRDVNEPRIPVDHNRIGDLGDADRRTGRNLRQVLWLGLSVAGFAVALQGAAVAVFD